MYSKLLAFILLTFGGIVSSQGPKNVFPVPVPTATERRLNQIESKLQNVMEELRGVTSKFQNFEKNQKSYLTSILSLQGKVGKMETEIQNLTTGYQRLETLNQLWKRNFKVVNTTFTALRTRFGFQLSPILGF